MKEEDGAGKRKCEQMMRIALFPILPDTSLLFPTALRGARTPLSLPMGNWKELKQQTITKYDYELLRHYGNQLGKASR